MIRQNIYTEHPSHKEIPIMDDLKEVTGVICVGTCFIVVFVVIMSLIINHDRD